jgi:hypothetical protein
MKSYNPRNRPHKHPHVSRKRALHCKMGIMSRELDSRSKYAPSGSRVVARPRMYRVNVNDLSPTARARASLEMSLARKRPYDE